MFISIGNNSKNALDSFLNVFVRVVQIIVQTIGKRSAFCTCKIPHLVVVAVLHVTWGTVRYVQVLVYARSERSRKFLPFARIQRNDHRARNDCSRPFPLKTVTGNLDDISLEDACKIPAPDVRRARPSRTGRFVQKGRDIVCSVHQPLPSLRAQLQRAVDFHRQRIGVVADVQFHANHTAGYYQLTGRHGWAMLIYCKKHVVRFRLSKRLEFVLLRTTGNRSRCVRFVDFNRGQSVSLSADWLWNQRFAILHKLPGYVCEDHEIRSEEDEESDRGVHLDIYEFLVLKPRLTELLNILRQHSLPVPQAAITSPSTTIPCATEAPTALVDFDVCGKLFRVPRDRIMKLSPVLSTMISARWSFSESAEQTAHKLREDEEAAPYVGEFFRFLHTGGAEVNLDRLNLLPLLKLANKYMVDELCKHCQDFLEQYISSGAVSAAEALRLWLCVRDISPDECGGVLLGFLRMNMTDVATSAEFLDLEYDHLQRLLVDQGPPIAVESEELLLKCLLKWSRKHESASIRELVQAKALDPDNLLLHESLFEKDAVLDALKFHACPFQVRRARQVPSLTMRAGRVYLCNKVSQAGWFCISSSSADRTERARLKLSRESATLLNLSFEKIDLEDCGGIDIALVFHTFNKRRQVRAVFREHIPGTRCKHDVQIRLEENDFDVEIVAECTFVPTPLAKRKLVF